jgi:hypothetical protein
MRLAGMLLATGTVLGCASPQVADNAANPAPAPVHEAAANTAPAAAPAAEQEGAAPAAAPSAAPAAATAKATSKAQSLPKIPGYKVVTKDGKQVYCAREYVTGSLLQTKTACYTPEQLEQLRRASRDAVNEVSRRTSPTAGGS